MIPLAPIKEPTKPQRRLGPELLQTVNAFRALLDKWQRETQYSEQASDSEADQDDSDSNSVPANSNLVKDFQDVVRKLRAKTDDNHRYHSSSKMTADRLYYDMGIKLSHSVKLKPDVITRAMETDRIGTEEHWSAQGLVRHLRFLEGLVLRANEGAARPRIDAFFYRASLLVPSGSRMVLNMEQMVPPVVEGVHGLNTLSGCIDYTAITTTEVNAGQILRAPTPLHFSRLDSTSAFFVSEAKGSDPQLVNHVPQAVAEMYACAMNLRKRTTRGVVTNGHEWIFLILTLNNNGTGGRYVESREISLMYRAGEVSEVSESKTSLLSAIIAHWAQNSHTELGDDDYFMVENFE